MMKAIWYEKFGPASDVLQYGDRAIPRPAHGDVLVQMECSAPNPSDVKKRAGSSPDLLSAGAVIPHSDGAGRIVEVGAGVSAARVGERVWVYQAQFQRQHGTAAQFVALPGECAVWLPDNADFATGACMGIPAMTAHRCVFADGPVDGQVLLITGGAGRVGYYAVQWARMAGAMVIATASDEAGRQDCMMAGADVVINHRDDDFVDQVRELAPGGVVDRCCRSRDRGGFRKKSASKSKIVGSGWRYKHLCLWQHSRACPAFLSDDVSGPNCALCHRLPDARGGQGRGYRGHYGKS